MQGMSPNAQVKVPGDLLDELLVPPFNEKKKGGTVTLPGILSFLLW